jgi:hypothetical protein
MALCPTLFLLQLFLPHHHIPLPDLPFEELIIDVSYVTMALCPTLFLLQLSLPHHHIPPPDLPFEELIIDVSYVTVFDKSRVFLESISLIARQRQSVRQLAKVIKLHAE